jgi:hypothetical protein
MYEDMSNKFKIRKPFILDSSKLCSEFEINENLY